MGETFVRRRMREPGIPEDQTGQPDHGGDGRWRAFNPRGQTSGENTTCAVVVSGVRNPQLLKGHKGGRIWPKMRLENRIDATIAHEFDDIRAGGKHAGALEVAAKTELPISDVALRLNRARAM